MHPKSPLKANNESTLFRVQLGYSLVSFAMKLFRLIPFRARYRLGEFLGVLAYHLDYRHRRIVRKNLQLAFPNWDESALLKVERASFVHFGRLIMEFMQFPRLTQKEVQRQVTIENMNYMEEALARGKGVIFLTAHFGNWELSAFAFSLLGKPLDVVVRPLDSKVFDMLVERYRTMGGNRIIKRRGGAREIMRALRSQHMVGILMDQNQLPSQGVFADFFGIPACTTPGVAVIARKAGCPVIPVFLLREGFEKYRLIFHEAVEIETSKDKEADVIVNTTKFNQVIERMVRQHPEQYFWLHRRWKTRPPGEPGLY